MKISDDKYFITWDPQNIFYYLYGTDLHRLQDGRISFKNIFVPPGTTLIEWHSKKNFQATRNTSSLPCLHRNKNYKFGFTIDSFPENTTYIKIEFFDFSGEIIDNVIVKQGDEVTVTIPAKMNYYCIQLVSSGCQEVIFDNIHIYPYPSQMHSESSYTISRVFNKSYFSKTLYVCFVEPGINRVGSFDKDCLSTLENVIVVNSLDTNKMTYFRKDLSEEIQHRIDDKRNREIIRQVVFVGYGPISNLAALFYAHVVIDSYALVTDEFYLLEDYLLLMEGHEGILVVNNIRSLLLTRFNPSQVKCYSKRSQYQLCQPLDYLIDKSNLLLNIDMNTIETWMNHNEV